MNSAVRKGALRGSAARYIATDETSMTFSRAPTSTPVFYIRLVSLWVRTFSFIIPECCKVLIVNQIPPPEVIGLDDDFNPCRSA